LAAIWPLALGSRFGCQDGKRRKRLFLVRAAGRCSHPPRGAPRNTEPGRGLARPCLGRRPLAHGRQFRCPCNVWGSRGTFSDGVIAVNFAPEVDEQISDARKSIAGFGRRSAGANLPGEWLRFCVNYVRNF